MTKEEELNRIIDLADHIEMIHEREMPGSWTLREIRSVHMEMHANRDHWDHEHWSFNK